MKEKASVLKTRLHHAGSDNLQQHANAKALVSHHNLQSFTATSATKRRHAFVRTSASPLATS
jgi:hypothetical protein